MAPPDNLNCYENRSPQSILLSPFPPFSNCIINPIVYTDHNYVFKNIDNLKKTTKITSDKCEMTSPENSASPNLLLNGDSKAIDYNLFHDVSLARHESPITCDADFLQGLDEIDFDFDDNEPSRGVCLENFIDATLDCTMEGSVIDDNDNDIVQTPNVDDDEDEEDIYKKEFFMKHVGLQRVASDSTPPKNRKRKREEIEYTTPSSSSFPFLSLPKTTMNSNRHQHHHKSHPVTIENNTQNDPVHTVYTPLSVPSKLCSCASNDWQRTILYSTAKSSHVTSVQTSPSTASVSGISSRGFSGINSPCHSDLSFNFQNNDHISPSVLLSDKAKDCFEFDLLDKSNMDEDTEDLLKWLDNQEIATTITRVTSTNDTTSALRSRSGSESDSSSIADDLKAILSPRSQTSCTSMELDTFMDLEAYVSDKPSPVKQNSLDEDDDVFQKPRLRLSILADISRDILNSEYREKKDAIKRDISRACRLNYKESLTNNHMTGSSDFNSGCWNDFPFSTSSSSSSLSSSPLSPSENISESLPSSPLFLQDTRSKSLDILDLFSDENAAWCL